MQLKIFGITLVCCIALVFALPTIVDNQYLPDWLQFYQIKLGLDIKGGSSVLLEVDMERAIHDRLILIKSDLLNDLQGKYESIEIQDGKVIVTGDQLDVYRGYSNFSANKIGNQLHFVPDNAFVAQMKKLLVDATIHTLSRRLDAVGINDISIYQYGTNRIIIQVPGIQDTSSIKSLIGKTAQLGFHLVQPQIQDSDFESPPQGFIVLPIIGQNLGHYLVSSYPVISGANLLDAQVLYEMGKPVVSIRFDHIGASKFAKITQEYLNHQLAIVLDQEVISAPVINSVITNGSAVISGNFSLKDANELAVMLASGSLPAPVTILEEKIVGPSLAANSIQLGVFASYIALGFIIAFMVLLYGWMGVFASLGLFINILLIIALLVVIQATLTLPGLVGLLLTIDMAVDSNVLIFERIQEEYQKNSNLLLSINNGYKLATSTIMDAHITTLITALTLFLFGSGPIQGFAITLGLGVFTSIFVSKILTKILILNWYYYFLS